MAPSSANDGVRDFAVDLSRLQTLKSQLGTLQHELADGPAGPARLASGLDPRTNLSSLTVSGNSDTIGKYVYGVLDESDPLGHAHLAVAGSMQNLITHLEQMVDAMMSSAHRAGGTYADAEAAVRTAAVTTGSDGQPGMAGRSCP